MAEREHAFLHMLKRNVRRGSRSSPQAERRLPGMGPPMTSLLFPLALILLFSNGIHTWFLLLFLGVIAAGSTRSFWFMLTPVSLADCAA